MRNSYLESYYSIINKVQQERLLEILKKQFDDTETSTDVNDLQSRLEKIIAELETPLGNPLVQYREAEKYGNINSDDYNKTMEEVYVDLGALFRQNNNINKAIQIHKGLNESILRDTLSSLRKVENDIIVYNILNKNRTGINDAKYNTFYQDDNQSISNLFKVDIDTDVETAKLKTMDDTSLLSINGLLGASIDLVHYGGGIRGTLETEEHRKEKAIDESMGTFWGEVILTDEPIRQIYEGREEFGAICEIVITLQRADLVNYIKFNPFINYPLTILKASYRLSENDTWTVIPEVIRTTSVNSLEFHFSDKLAKQVKISINQKNPSINTYKIPRRIVNNAQMWQQIVDKEYSISTSTSIPIQATQDMIDYVSGWQAYVDALENYSRELNKTGTSYDSELISRDIINTALNEVNKASDLGAEELEFDLYNEKTTKEEELVEVRKYEYVYGAYNIAIKKLWYVENGEYISPKYHSNGSILECLLDVTDIVPSGTSIEYQVSTRENEWKNILPSGSIIYNERLDINPQTYTGILRFPAETNPSGVYMNDIYLDASKYSYTEATRSIVLDSDIYLANARYTTIYMPKGISDVTPSGVVVSFINDAPISTSEIFTNIGTRQYSVELSHYPYVNYSIINDTTESGEESPSFTYSTGRWQNTGTRNMYSIVVGEYYDPFTVTVNGYSAENRTDYYKNENPLLGEYNQISYPQYEYIQVGRKIYLNSPLSDSVVRVDYNYINDYISFRALLRNNNASTVTSTPELYDYTLKLRTK